MIMCPAAALAPSCFVLPCAHVLVRECAGSVVKLYSKLLGFGHLIELIKLSFLLSQLFAKLVDALLVGVCGGHDFLLDLIFLRFE